MTDELRRDVVCTSISGNSICVVGLAPCGRAGCSAGRSAGRSGGGCGWQKGTDELSLPVVGNLRTVKPGDRLRCTVSRRGVTRQTMLLFGVPLGVLLLASWSISGHLAEPQTAFTSLALVAIAAALVKFWARRSSFAIRLQEYG